MFGITSVLHVADNLKLYDTGNKKLAQKLHVAAGGCWGDVQVNTNHHGNGVGIERVAEALQEPLLPGKRLRLTMVQPIPLRVVALFCSLFFFFFFFFFLLL